MSQTNDLLEEHIKIVNKCILDEIDSPVQLVNQVCAHLITSGGKRIRPALLLLSTGLINNSSLNDQKFHRIAAAIEILHTATLMHDDVIDESDLRRGQPSVNKAFSNSIAVLGGDYLFTKAFNLASDVDNINVFKDFSRAIGTLASGEIEQLGNVDDPSLNEASYFHVIYAKTAILFEIAVRIPGLILNVSNEQLNALTNYGKHLGNAFQIADDILDYTAESSELGKNIGDDLQDQKVTLPVIYTLNELDDTNKKIAIEAIHNKDINTILKYIKSTNAIEKCYKKAHEESQKAVTAIQLFEKNPYRDALSELAITAVERKK